MKESLPVLLLLLMFQGPGMCQGAADPTSPTHPQPMSMRDQHRQNNRELEVGIAIGNAYGLHDLSGDPGRDLRLFIWDTNWDIVNMHFGAFSRLRATDHLGLMLGLNYGKVSGSYVFYPEDYHRHQLGYSFQNHLLELALTGEVYLPRIHPELPFDIYGFGGMAVFFHHPKPGSQGNVPPLPDISRLGLGVPLGSGVLYTFRNHYRVGATIGWRKTFTDYLDGYKSGDGMDSYFFISLNISYMLQSYKNRHFLYP